MVSPERQGKEFGYIISSPPTCHKLIVMEIITRDRLEDRLNEHFVLQGVGFYDCPTGDTKIDQLGW